MVLSGTQNRTFGPFLAAIKRIIITLMRRTRIRVGAVAAGSGKPHCATGGDMRSPTMTTLYRFLRTLGSCPGIVGISRFCSDGL
jgi:hypothetical protein